MDRLGLGLLVLLTSNLVHPCASTAAASLNISECSILQPTGLWHPEGVTVDAAGNMYVASEHQITKWPLGSVSSDPLQTVAGNAIAGSTLEQLDRPRGLLLNSNGDLVISDFNNNRVLVWTPGAASGVLWGAADLGYPVQKLAWTPTEELMIVRWGQDRPYLLAANGTLTALDPSPIAGGGSCCSLADVAVASDGQVYVLEKQTGGVLRYATGEWLARDAAMIDAESMFLDSLGYFWVGAASKGLLKCYPDPADPDNACELMLGEGELSLVRDIAFAPNDINYVYLAETGSHHIVTCPTLHTTSTTSTTSATSSSTTSSSISTTSSSTSTASSTSTTSTSRTSTTSSTTTTSSSATSSSTSSSTSSTSASTTTTSSTTVTTSSSSRTSTTSVSSTTTSVTGTTSTSSSTSTTSRSTTTTSLTTSTSSSSVTTSTSTTITSSSSATSTSSTSVTSTLTNTATTSTRTTTTSTVTTPTTNTSTTAGTTTNTDTPTTTASTTAISTNTSTATPTTLTTTTTLTSTSMTSTLTTASTSTSTSTSTSSSSTTIDASGGAAQATTEPPDPAEVAADLLRSVAAASAGLRAQLQGSDAQATVSIPGGSLTAVRLASPESLANASNDGITVAVAGVPGGMEMTLPLEVFQGLPASSVPGDSVALVVAAFSSEIAKSLGGQVNEDSNDQDQGKVVLEVLSVVSIDLSYLLSGEDIEVTGLGNPIVFQLPGVNYSAGLRCGNWREEDSRWSLMAPAEGNEVGQPLVCHTTHLSFFGAIQEVLRSFVGTLECAQFNLLSSEAVQNIFRDPSWTQSHSAWICWVILECVLLALALAAVMDCRRRRHHCWRDEYFLIAVVVVDPEDGCGSEESEAWKRQLSRMSTVARTASRRVSERAKGASQSTGQHAVYNCLLCLWASSALREAVDEIMSSWCQYWSDVRGAVEALCEAVAQGAGGPFATWSRLSHHITAMLLLASSRRLAAASLGMTNEAVTFVLEDEDLQDFISEHPAEAPVGTRADDWKTSEDQRVAWTSLHDQVVHHVLDHTGRHTAHGLPRIALEFFLVHNPVSALFMHDIFHTCKKRVLLLAVDLVGGMAMSCVFFNAAGMVRGKPLRAGDDCGREPAFTWKLGRFLAIATGSLAVSGVPMTLIDSLHTKGFRKLDARGSEAWKRQLRIWATQDKIVWTLSLIYMAFCLFFIFIFLASIGPQDHDTWSQAGIVVVAEDFAIIPAFLAVSVPAMTAMLLQLLGSCHRTDRDTVLRRSQETLLRQTSLMTPITRI